MIHIPVLTKEVIDLLNPKPNENFVDCTAGEAGHAVLILEKTSPGGKLVGIDLDAGQIENSRHNTKEYENRVTLVNDSYRNIKDIVKNADITGVDGMLLDLGYSSWQIEQSGRGFSFMRDEELDMRYNAKFPIANSQFTNGLTAKEIINHWPEEKLEEIFKIYGEEKFARKIAQNIVTKRRVGEINNTFALKKVIEESIPGKFQHGRIHSATRVFQALRIAVNGELENLENFLPQAIEVLSPGGRLVVISFHSLEDRIVKKFFIGEAKKGRVRIITKKPITASFEEISKNHRARSAKLRAVVKIQN